MFTENLRSKAIFQDFTESFFTSVLCREFPSTPVSLNFSNIKKIMLKVTNFSHKITINTEFFISHYTQMGMIKIMFPLVSSKFCSQSITNQSYVTKLQLFLNQYTSQEEQFEPMNCLFE